MAIASFQWRRAVALLVGSMATWPPVTAQAPVNDVCANAAALTIGGANLIANLFTATSDETQVGDDCGGNGPAFIKDYKGMWYSFTGTGARLTINTCFTDYLDTDISVYTGSCGISTLQCVVGSFTGRACQSERLMFNTVAGTTYYVLYRTIRATALAGSSFIASLATVPVVPNDVCTTAAPLVLGSRVTGNITFATSDETQMANENDCAGGNIWIRDRPGLWYSFVGTGGRVWVDTCFTGSIATYISIYRGGCGKTSLQCVAGTFDPCLLEKFMLDTEVGVTYYVLVRKRNIGREASSTFDLRISSIPTLANEVCPGAAPLALGASTVGNLTFATSDEAQVANEDDCNGGNSLIRDRPGLWYSFAGTGGRVWATTCFAGSVSTYLSVYKGSCGKAALQCTAGTYDPCALEKFMFDTETNTTYYLLARPSSTGVVPTATFNVRVNSIPAVTNEACSGAIPLTVGARVTGNLTFAAPDETQVANENDCTGGNDRIRNRPGLWYSVVGTGGRMWATTCFEGSVGTYISVYKGSCGRATLQCVAGTYDPCAAEAFMFDTDAGTMYYLLVRSSSLSSVPVSTFDLRVNSIPTLSNEVCARATPFVIGTIVSGNLTYAASDENEVANENDCAGGNDRIRNRPGIWYSFQGTGGRMWATTCFTGSVATYISVYKGSCGQSTLQCVTGTYDSCALEKFTFNTDVGTTYYVLVRWASSVNRVFSLRITNLLPSPTPSNVNANDLCANAAPFSIGSTVRGNVTLATTDDTAVPSDCLAGNPIGARPGLWYRFNGTGASTIANTCWDNSALRTHVSVYKGTCGSSTLTCVAGSYDTCVAPAFEFATEVGTQYYMLVRTATTTNTGSRIFDLASWSVATPSLTLPPVVAPAPSVGFPVTPVSPSVPIVPPSPVPPTPTLRPPTSAPVVPVPTAPVIPTAPVPSVTAPVPVGAPRVPAPTAPVIPTAPVPTVTAPVPVGAPRAPVPTAPVPAGAPTAPVTAPTAGPKKCGLLGFRLFCPVTRCGLLGRLFGICKK